MNKKDVMTFDTMTYPSEVIDEINKKLKPYKLKIKKPHNPPDNDNFYFEITETQLKYEKRYKCYAYCNNCKEKIELTTIYGQKASTKIAKAKCHNCGCYNTLKQTD